MKSDGENAAVDLTRHVARKMSQSATVTEKSEPYDSMSNGLAEKAVRRLESLACTLKIATEGVVGKDIDVLSPLFAWLVRHADDVLTECSVGKDGRTP